MACKHELISSVNDFLTPFRERRAELELRPNDVLEILFEGTKKARAVARETLVLVKERMHLDYFGRVA